MVSVSDVTAPDLLQPFLARARREPDRALVTLHRRDGAEILTHGALLVAADRQAAMLAAEGVRAGDVVFVSLRLGAELFAVFLGALRIGAIPSLLPYPTPKQDPALFWSSHAALFRHTGARLLVTFPENRDAIARNLPADAIRVSVPGEGGCATPEPAVRPATDVACLQHSSGTTGLKKGVPLTHAAILAQVESYASALGLTADSRLVSWLPLYHDMGFVACWLTPVVLGCHVATLDPFEWLSDPLRLLEVASADRSTHLWLPNFAFQHLANAADDRRRVDLSSVELFVNCSEPCKAETFDGFADRFAIWGVRRNQLAVSYAMAEAVFAVSQTPPGAPVSIRSFDRAALDAGWATPADGPDGVRLVSAGRPIAGVAVAIRDAAGRALPDGSIGEITVAGFFIFDGYFRRELRPDGLFHGEFYRTNDLGFRLDGELFVLGRMDDLVIVQGRNVFAHEIEGLVSVVPGVKAGRAVAFGLFNPDIGSEDVVVLAELAGPEADKAAIRRGIRERLQSTIGIVPARIATVEPGWLVKTTSGKISRGSNRDKYLAEQNGSATGRAA